MGCDIHLIIAKYDGTKVETINDFESGDEGTDWDAYWRKWRHTVGRNYPRFGMLSNVRREGPDPNGWPEWATDAFKWWLNEDLHSLTHYPIREAAKIWAESAYESDLDAVAAVNPVAMYFDIDPERPDLDQLFVLIAYDN